MRFHLAPAPLLHLLTTILLAPTPTAAKPQPAHSALRGYTYAELFQRWECGGVKCGYYDQLCCSAGSGCYTNSLTQAECTSHAPNSQAGHWTYYTYTTVVTDRETITTVESSYIPGASSGWGGGASSGWVASSSARCNYAIGESSCMNKCCKSDEYCKNGDCVPAYPGQTTTTATRASGSASSALPGVRQTSHSGVVITQTSSPTRTVHYQTPIATGANVTVTESSSGGAQLSGGAIAGIVIGVLVALFLLGLVCFYCCLKGLWDGLLAIFGLNRRRKVTEVDEYTRRSHYSSDGRRRNWYGAPIKTRKEKRDSHVGRDLLGLGAGLAGLWAILGMKRRREERRKVESQQVDKYSEYSYSSEYYTSASSASSDDRRTERYSRHSVRRSDSRRP